MSEDILRILKSIWRTKVKSQGQSVDFDQTLTFYKIREEKVRKYYENYIFKNYRERGEFWYKDCDFYIRIRFTVIY